MLLLIALVNVPEDETDGPTTVLTFGSQEETVSQIMDGLNAWSQVRNGPNLRVADQPWVYQLPSRDYRCSMAVMSGLQWLYDNFFSQGAVQMNWPDSPDMPVYNSIWLFFFAIVSSGGTVDVEPGDLPRSPTYKHRVVYPRRQE